MREGLDTRGGIVVDQDIVHGKAGTGEKIQVNGAHLDGAVQRGFERGLNARAESIGAYSRRCQADQRHQSQRNENRAPQDFHNCRAKRCA